MQRLGSIGMVGRIVLVLIVAVLLELLGNVALQRWQEPELLSPDQTRRIAAKLVEAEGVTLAYHPRDRGRAMEGLAAPPITLNWVSRTVITNFGTSPAQLEKMRADMIASEPSLALRELRLTLMPSEVPGQRDLLGARQLADGSFVTFRVSPYLDAPPPRGAVVAMHLLLVAAVLLVAVLVVRALVRPLRNLAQAADATSQGQIGAIEVEGPPEVRRVATAFSGMQARLIKTMEGHTQSLVAVSHDLRTPIQRMQLRASLIDDPETRETMAADLEEMEHFIVSTLAYVRSGEEEAIRLVDVAAIAMTAVDTAGDLGANIRYCGPDALEVRTRPLAIKRILGNLIDNARRYAARIEVTLGEISPQSFMIEVEDDGPGIPPNQRDEAMLPFKRLDREHRQRGGGAGLGLASTKKAVDAMGDTLNLGDSSLGGLKVTLTLSNR